MVTSFENTMAESLDDCFRCITVHSQDVSLTEVSIHRQ